MSDTNKNNIKSRNLTNILWRESERVMKMQSFLSHLFPPETAIRANT